MTRPSIWTFQDNFDFRRDISPGDSLYYPLEQHRGAYSRQVLLNPFNLDPEGKLRPGVKPKEHEAVLFGGHIGCGKSTELREYARLLSQTYTVKAIELTKVLDINNLRFSDLLIALVHELIKTFEDAGMGELDETLISPLQNWFESRIVKQDRFRDIEAEIKTEAKSKGGIPWLIELLATMKAKMRSGASYREELRREIRDGYSQLVDRFNALIAHANHRLNQRERGPLVFIIDGSDKLSREDSGVFFGEDLNQLQQIRVNMVVCAPISVLLEVGFISQRFTKVQLPMVKIFEPDGSIRLNERDALVELVCKRMPLDYFDDIETVRYLVVHSGGHLRDLLRLVKAGFARLQGEVFTYEIACKAVQDVATEYQRLVQKDDWAELVAIDRSEGGDKDRTDARLRLLYDLVLLEYNKYWWRTHPLVTTLASYQKLNPVRPKMVQGVPIRE